MRGQPDPGIDPYATLGLQPGATMAEVKRAYRLLAKAFHPDSAGDAATPRFLAIQDAYDQLRSGRPAATPRSSRTAPPPAAEPWRADPSRARAARERSRTARGGPAKGTGPAGPAAGRSGKATGGTTGGGTRGTGRRRDTRKATMGSTSYDEARDPSDATWSGASWYGPSSGEYWIVNPREYADPRKHGPEYQERARRPLGDERDVEPDAAPVARGTPVGDPGATDRPVEAKAEFEAGPSRAPSEATSAAVDRGTLLVPSRWWTGWSTSAPLRRFRVAGLAAFPLWLIVANVSRTVPGCYGTTPGCYDPQWVLRWLAYAAILGILLRLPTLSRLLAGGGLAMVLAFVPILILLATIDAGGGIRAVSAAVALFAGAWVAGVTWSAWEIRRGRAGESTQ